MLSKELHIELRPLHQYSPPPLPQLTLQHNIVPVSSSFFRLALDPEEEDPLVRHTEQTARILTYVVSEFSYHVLKERLEELEEVESMEPRLADKCTIMKWIDPATALIIFEDPDHEIRGLDERVDELLQRLLVNGNNGTTLKTAPEEAQIRWRV